MSLSQKITIHQFHYSTTDGDAVTNHMRLIRDSLGEVGIAGEVFAVENKAPAEYGILDFGSQRSRLWKADLILVHHSHGNPALGELLAIDIPKALVYHNVTPAAYFPHDRYLAKLCESGRRQLREWREHAAVAFAVSKYNARELRAFGFPRVLPLPLIDLETAIANTPRRRPLSGATERRLLFVGRSSLHKNQALLIETLFYLQRYQPGKYRLALVGGGDPVYAAYLRDLTRMLELETQVEFLGKISPSELEDQYTRASAFVCPSQHEGFGIPLVEAMQRELPVFALPKPGVRETLGRAGVRLGTSRPHRIAAIIQTVLDRPDVVRQILTGQSKRLEELRAFQNRARIREACTGLVGELRHGTSNPVRPASWTGWSTWFSRRTVPQGVS